MTGQLQEDNRIAQNGPNSIFENLLGSIPPPPGPPPPVNPTETGHIREYADDIDEVINNNYSNNQARDIADVMNLAERPDNPRPGSRPLERPRTAHGSTSPKKLTRSPPPIPPPRLDSKKNIEHLLIISENSTEWFRYTFPRKPSVLSNWINLSIWRQSLQKNFSAEKSHKFQMPKGVELLMSILPEIIDNQYKYEHGLGGVLRNLFLTTTNFIHTLPLLKSFHPF